MTAGKTRRTTAMRSPTATVSAIAVAGALLLTGCTDQLKDSGGDAERVSTNSAPLADKLPEAIRKAGEIRVGSDIAYPPVEFKDDSGKTVGIDPDLADAMGKQLGVKFTFENGPLDTLLNGLLFKHYDIVMSAMTDTKDRQEGVDFVDYFTAGVSLYTKKGDTQSIRTWSDLCGKKLVLQRGTASHHVAKAEAKKCPKGKTMSIKTFGNDQQAQTRLRSGDADAGSSDFPVAAYSVKTSGGGKDFELVGEQVEAAPYGIAIAKSNPQLRDAIKAALDAIIASGEYDGIIKKWGVEDGAVKGATINGGR